MGRRTAREGAQFTDEVVSEAVRLYVQGLPSYRTLSSLLESRVGRPVSRMTISRWVDRAGAAAKTPLEVSAELTPSCWSGVLGVDGKVIRVAGSKHCLLIGVDQGTQDIVHALTLNEENGEGLERLLREAVVIAGYPLRGLVADLGAGFVEAHQNYFPRLPFQACRIHYDRHLDQYIPKLKRSKKAVLHAEFKTRLRAVVYASSYDEACRLLYDLSADRRRFQGLGKHDPLRALEAKFGLYMAHHRHSQLPADNNVTENVIKQLGKKLRLMEGFSTIDSAERFSRLLIGCYRFKRFTDSIHKPSNGKSPLELAGVDPLPRDWLNYHLTPLTEQHSM